jgi:1-acyl-sn-glycerol-3-phosphate acyltransferase
MRLYYRICWTILRLYLKLFCKLQIVGAGNVPQSGGVIVASNHIAGGDPPFVGACIKRESYFLAKRELFRNFFLRNLIGSLNAIPVDRSTLDRGALQAAGQALGTGHVLVLFPEGTRSKTGELRKGKPGIGLLARKAVVPIVPARIENSKGFMKLIFTEKRLRVTFGRPISTEWIESEPDSNDGYRRIAERAMSSIAELDFDSKMPHWAAGSDDGEPHEKPFA